MKSFLFLLVLTLACRGTPTTDGEHPDDYRLVLPAYVVLAQKALTYQIDGDTEGWSGMLADTLHYIPPDGDIGRQPKAVAVRHWRSWWHGQGVVSARLSTFTHLPIESKRQLALWNKSGVCVVSYCLAELTLTNGQRRLLRLNLCCHFDAHRQIDGYLLSFNALLTHPLT